MPMKMAPLAQRRRRHGAIAAVGEGVSPQKATPPPLFPALAW
jgi:hypothetical protein